MKKTIWIGIILAFCVAFITSMPFNSWVSIGQPVVNGRYDGKEVYSYYDSEWGVVVYQTYNGICAVKVK